MKSLNALKGISENQIDEGQELAQKLELEMDDHIKRDIISFNKKIYGFHPSEINQCARYLWYLFGGATITPNYGAQLQRIFDNGHDVHERIYRYLDGMGILEAKELPINVELEIDEYYIPIQGTCDGIINFHGKRLIEIKSINDMGFQHRKIYQKPKDDHFRQAQLYMSALELDNAFVIYENKNNQSILVIPVVRDDAFLKKLYIKYGKIYQAHVDKKMPKRPYKKTSQKCQDCRLHDFCWGGADGDIKI